VAEARKLNIPIVAVVDSNHCPDGIDYMIPGNDDAIRSIELYLKTAADAIAQGRVTIPEAAVTGSDEFVELDASGEPIRRSPKEEDERAALRKTAVPRKKTIKKKVSIRTRSSGAAPAARGSEDTDTVPAAEDVAADAPEPSAP
ncbi:MAG: 30S ribosomal protein S2, partial [Gammaproteobacteria bacterium]